MKSTHPNEQTRARLLEHCQSYPDLQAQDVFKYLYHSALGCEHLVSDEQAALRYIEAEYATLPDSAQDTIEPLDGAYSRVHLGMLRHGLQPRTLARLFCLSAQTEADGKALLAQKLRVAQEMVQNRELLLDEADFAQKLDAWRAANFPAIHHSEAFRTAYHPAYRVVSNRYTAYLPLFAAIDKLLCKGSAIVAIDGGSASGKTTLASLLAQVYDCNVFHTDDFFLQLHRRTPKRLAEIGGNLDRERFADQVLRSVCKQESVKYQRFDCSTQTLGERITVPHNALTVIEGAYSLHPSFGQYCHLAVFLDVDPATQRERITKRNTPAFAQRFFDEWIPLENAYFSGTNIRDRVDMIFLARDE